MRYFALFLFVLLSGIGTASAASSNPADWYTDPVTGVVTWVAPDEATIPNNATGDMIRYGKLLLTETAKYLGAGAPVQYTYNKLSCTNCHLDEGRAAFGTPWAVVAYKYGGKGTYSARSNRYLDMKNRIHDCTQRSMNGYQLPDDSYELLSMVEYMNWMATGMKVADWTKVVGQGNAKASDLTRPADPVRGRTVYEDQCAACHQSDGSGVWDANAKKYIYPALWGANSFNTGAGMFRLRTAVPFVKGNMPYGWANATDPLRQLNLDDAWDVTAYVMSQERTMWSGYLNDWTGTYTPTNCMPNWLRKNPDAGYENFFPRIKSDGTLTGDLAYPAKYSAAQHMYGPWQGMIAEQNALQAAYLAAPNTPPYCQPWP